MTPMVDVAFLLLIFFMSTTQFKPPEEVAVTLPASNSEIKVPETGIIVLTVNKDGRVFIGGDKGDAQEMPKNDMATAIMAFRSRNPTARVLLKGDKNAEFGIVADLMNAMQETQTNRFNLMTELEATQPSGSTGAH